MRKVFKFPPGYRENFMSLLEQGYSVRGAYYRAFVGIEEPTEEQMMLAREGYSPRAVMEEEVKQ